MTDLLAPAFPVFVNGVTDLDASHLNAIPGPLNSKADKIGTIIRATTTPGPADGENGEVRWVTSTKLLHVKASDIWDAGVPFNASDYDLWVAAGLTGPSGGQTYDDFNLSRKGQAGDSVTLTTASVPPTEIATGEIVLVQSIPTPVTYNTAGGVTYTVADLLKERIMRDCNGSGRTDTLPTAALLIAGLTSPVIGQAVECRISNVSVTALTITLAAGVGGGWSSSQVAATRVIPYQTSRVVTLLITNVLTPAYVAYL